MNFIIGPVHFKCTSAFPGAKGPFYQLRVTGPFYSMPFTIPCGLCIREVL